MLSLQEKEASLQELQVFNKENKKGKKGKKKAEGESIGKKEELNTIKDDSGNEEGDILLTSGVEMAALVTT